MSIFMALAGSVLSVGSIWTLISNVSGACNSMINLCSTIVFVVCTVAAADGWYKMLGKSKKA